MNRVIAILNQDIRGRDNQILRKLCGSGKADQLKELREKHGLTALDARSPAIRDVEGNIVGFQNEGLCQAARCGHASVLQELLNFGLGNVDALTPHSNARLPPCSEALMVALSGGFADCIRVLRKGYRLSIRDLQRCIAVLAKDRREIHEDALDTVAELFRLRYPEARQVLKTAFVAGDVPMFQWIARTYRFTANDLFRPVEELAHTAEASNPTRDNYDPELQAIDDAADAASGQTWEGRVDFDGSLRRVSFGAKEVQLQREKQLKGLFAVLVNTLGMTMEHVRDVDGLALVRLAVQRKYPDLLKMMKEELDLQKIDILAAFKDMELNSDGHRPGALAIACANDDQLMVEVLHEFYGFTAEDAREECRLAVAEAMRCGATHALTAMKKCFALEPEDIYAAAEARLDNEHWKWDYVFGHRVFISYLNGELWGMTELDADLVIRPATDPSNQLSLGYTSASETAVKLLHADCGKHFYENIKKPVNAKEDLVRLWDEQMRDEDCFGNPVVAAKEAFATLSEDQKMGQLGQVYRDTDLCTAESSLLESASSRARALVGSDLFLAAAKERMSGLNAASLAGLH